MSGKKISESFESDLAALEAIIAKMEAGSLSLEESLEAFEKGVKLTKQCQKTLASAEQKVKVLTAKTDQPDHDQISSKPFTLDAMQEGE